MYSQKSVTKQITQAVREAFADLTIMLEIEQPRAEPRKVIYGDVRRALRAAGLKATTDGDLVHVGPLGKTKTFDLSTPDGRHAWRALVLHHKAKHRAKIRRELARLRRRKVVNIWDCVA